MKKKLILCIVIIILIVGVIIGGFKIFTKKENKVEEDFIIGDVNINVEEENWNKLLEEKDENENGIPDAAEIMGPGQTISKDPVVKNNGANDAYVYLRVTVPKANVKIIGQEEIENQEVFEYNLNMDNWQLMGDLTIDENDKAIYTYYYKNVEGTENYLKSKQTTEPLFTQVTLADVTDFTQLDMTKQVEVKAYAIQTNEEITVNSNEMITKFKNEKEKSIDKAVEQVKKNSYKEIEEDVAE